MRRLEPKKTRMVKPNSIDLREEFHHMIENHGHHILLVRQSPTGWRVERHKVISGTSSVPETLPRMLQHHQIGFIASNAFTVFFRYNAHIRAGDWIFAAHFDEYGRVLHPGDMLRVNHVDYKREHLGRVEFIAAGCDREQGGGPEIDVMKTRYIDIRGGR